MTELSLKILFKIINSVPLFIKGTFMKCLWLLFQNRLMDEEHVEYNI